MATWTLLALTAAEEQRLEVRRAAVESFLGRSRGRQLRCDLVRVDGAKIHGQVSKTLRGRPAVLRNLWRGRMPWTKANFLEKFGSYRVKSNNGHFDFLRSKEVMTVSEYLSAEVSEWNLFFADMAYSLQRDVWHALGAEGPLPLVEENFDARPILSLGVKASSTRSHQHAETFQLLLSGLKAWWLARPGYELDTIGDPCEALATASVESPAKSRHELPEEPWLCIQNVGEAMYFGDHFPHATCNLEAFVLGFGAQGLSQSWPPLHQAAHSNNLNGIQQLVEEGVSLNQRYDQVTPLHRAVAQGHLAAAQRLVAAGAKVRLKDREGKSPGTMAAERGDLPLLRFLSEAQPLKEEEAGQALRWAALSGHVPVMEFLLSLGASVHATDERGLQPIHFAALESDVSSVAFLVEHGANVSATGLAAEQAIHWAAGVGHAPIIDYLLSQRADCEAADARGSRAMHFAAAQDRLEAAQSLAACGVPAGALQAAKGHRRLVSLLLQDGQADQSMVEEKLRRSAEL